jgi:hypothetical protein
MSQTGLGCVKTRRHSQGQEATFKEGKELALFGGNSHSQENNNQAASVGRG